MAVTLVAQTTFDHTAANNDTLTYSTTGHANTGRMMMVLATRSGGTATGAMTSVTDSATNTWTNATIGSVSGASNTRIECWYTYTYAAVTSISLNSATSQYYATHLSEWSGLNVAASPVDVVSPADSGSAAATTSTTPGIAVTGLDLVIAAIHYTQASGTFNSAGAAPTSGWTNLTAFDSTTVGSGRAAYQVMTSTGTYDGSWTLGASMAAGQITVGFKPATGATFSRSISDSATASDSITAQALSTRTYPVGVHLRNNRRMQSRY
jgi:hypothetical protein